VNPSKTKLKAAPNWGLPLFFQGISLADSSREVSWLLHHLWTNCLVIVNICVLQETDLCVFRDRWGRQTVEVTGI